MRSLFGLLVTLSVLGCNDVNEAESAVQKDVKSKSIFDGQLEALEKANDVEQTLEDATKLRDKKMNDRDI